MINIIVHAVECPHKKQTNQQTITIHYHNSSTE